MDNRDFLPYMRVAQLPEFNPLHVSLSPAQSRPSSFFSWLVRKLQSIYRYCYVHLHDLILSSLFGYLTLNEKLYVAVHENDFYRARKLLSVGASPTFLPTDCKSTFKHLIRNNHGNNHYCAESSLFSSILAHDSMLYMAVANNNLSLIKKLIDFHDYGSVGQHTEVVSLCLAVKRGYFNIVQYLIDFGHINPRDSVKPDCKHCKTHPDDVQRYHFPLYHACRENHLNIVKYLIMLQNCDINQLTTTYETCLHGAILGAIKNRFDSSVNNQQRYQIVQYLLARSDCNPNLGVNPLCISLSHDYIYDYTTLLLQHDCNVNRLGWNLNEPAQTTSKRNSHLLFALDHPLNICLRCLCRTNKNTTVADHSYHVQHALKLICENSNIYAMYDNGLPYPFLLAVQTGDQLIVQTMLRVAKSQIRLDIIEPFIHACTKSFYGIVQLLIEFGFDPNAVMLNGDYTKTTKANLENINTSDFLQILNRYSKVSATTPLTRYSSPSQMENNRLCAYLNSDQEITPFLALSHMSTWIFHPDAYNATVKTIENLFSHTSIDFSIEPNRLAFYYALINEHMPIVYYCLANFCPINLLHNTIEFTNFPLKNHFSYTLFHLISACCRLTTNNRTKRSLFDAYAKSILRIYTYDRSSSMVNVLAYMKLWLTDEDFVSDPVLFEHITSLPMIDDIILSYNANKLRSIFGEYYDRIIERRPYSRPMYTLKELCRLKIRHESEISCDRQQTNLLKTIPQLTCLPKILIGYLFYTRIKSGSLINRLLNNESWNNIQWM